MTNDLCILGRAMRHAQRVEYFNIVRSSDLSMAEAAFDKALEAAPDARDAERLYSALWQAAPHVCSLLCPSVKKTNESWTHVPLCEEITAALYPPIMEHKPAAPTAPKGESAALIAEARQNFSYRSEYAAHVVMRLVAALEAAERQLAEAREALEWYASDEAWTAAQVEGPDGDYGKRARAALGRKPIP